MMSSGRSPSSVPKLTTGIPGFDLVADGGLPSERATLLAGTAGSGKTVFATHFLAAGIMHHDQHGVLVTFEDKPDEIRRNMLGFGWDIAQWESERKLAFVDVSPELSTETAVVGSYDLRGLLSRIEHAVRKVGAKRVVLDSLSALFMQFPDARFLRAELFRIIEVIKGLGATVVFTAERNDDYGAISQNGVEEFVADNVVILRNILADERRRRTLEILKFRGARHERGEVPFTVMERGIIVIPLVAEQLTQASTMVRVSSGIKELDAMCGHGLFRDSVVLVSGATGTGKTLMVTEFLAGRLKQRERSLLFAFEESRDQLFRNAHAWGLDFAKAEKDGYLKVVNHYPHAMPMEDHLVRMRDDIAGYEPHRVAVDSLSALERVFSVRSFREFVIALTSTLKQKSITTMFTSTSPSLLGGASVTEKHISTLTDSIILLRYVERAGRMRRAITVLKMRGSSHDSTLREFTIDGNGMTIGKPFSEINGILSGRIREVSDDNE